MYNYPQWFRNTLFIATMSCLIGTFLTVLTAYTMSRFQFKSRKAMMKTTLILGMFPSFMGMIAVYIIMTQFGLINKMWGLILIYSANAPMGYLTQKGFFDTIPSSIDEAARIDGASRMRVLLHILLPLVVPGLVAVGIYTFLNAWDDYLMALTIMKSNEMRTLPVGIAQSFLGEYSNDYGGLMAFAVAGSLPIVLLFIFFQKYLVSGMTAGAVKG